MRRRLFFFARSDLTPCFPLSFSQTVSRYREKDSPVTVPKLNSHFWLFIRAKYQLVAKVSRLQLHFPRLGLGYRSCKSNWIESLSIVKLNYQSEFVQLDEMNCKWHGQWDFPVNLLAFFTRYPGWIKSRGKSKRWTLKFRATTPVYRFSLHSCEFGLYLHSGKCLHSVQQKSLSVSYNTNWLRTGEKCTSGNIYRCNIYFTIKSSIANRTDLDSPYLTLYSIWWIESKGEFNSFLLYFSNVYMTKSVLVIFSTLWYLH